MPVQTNTNGGSPYSSIENQKLQVLREIAQSQRMIAQGLQQIFTVLQRIEMMRK